MLGGEETIEGKPPILQLKLQNRDQTLLIFHTQCPIELPWQNQRLSSDRDAIQIERSEQTHWCTSSKQPLAIFRREGIIPVLDSQMERNQAANMIPKRRERGFLDHEWNCQQHTRSSG